MKSESQKEKNEHVFVAFLSVTFFDMLWSDKKGAALLKEDTIMSKKEGYSRKGFLGNTNHYDANGRKVGESRQGFFCGINHYDD